MEQKKKVRKITQEMMDYIIEKYPYEDNKIIAEKLGISPNTVANKTHSQGLKKIIHIHNAGNFTQEQKRLIMKHYPTMDNEELAKFIGYTGDYRDITKYAITRKITKQKDKVYGRGVKGVVDFFKEKRNNPNYDIKQYLGHSTEPRIPENELYKSKYGKYHVNRNYFEKIDNEWKAYWLGFMYADGWNCSDKHSIGLRLQESDKEHIQKFKDSLQSDSKTYFSKGGDTIIIGKNCHAQNQYSVSISNDKICKDLSNLGCVPRKTYILKFPTEEQVPKDLMRHFIRGFLDGDGYISVYHQSKTQKDGTQYKSIRCIIGAEGMESFIIPMANYITNTLGLHKHQKKQKKGRITVTVEWTSLHDVEKIYNFLYNGANIYLDRKLQKLDEYYCLGQYEV